MGSDGQHERGQEAGGGFNSRSRMGSDGLRLGLGGLLGGFNSRSRMGSDGIAQREGARALVSIHAPAWGATRCGVHGQRELLVSIHAPAWGATWPRATPSSASPSFQFTLPHGERPRSLAWKDKTVWVSIHAPAWGATHERAKWLRWQRVSIHAPAWGATMPASCLALTFLFQFTLPHGERHEVK